MPLKGPKTFDQIRMDSPHTEHYVWAFYLSRELQEIDIESNTKTFQPHGNKCAEDISRSRGYQTSPHGGIKTAQRVNCDGSGRQWAGGYSPKVEKICKIRP